MRLYNFTVFGQKAWAYLGSVPEEGKPDIIAATETHLKDLHLNRARRRSTSLDWHMFATRAVSSQTLSLDGSRFSSSAEVPSMSANHGGEAILAQPHVHATGYRQDVIIVNMKQLNIHITLVCSDCTVGLDGGANIEQCNKSAHY